MFKRFVALACTLVVGAAFFVTTTGCNDTKKPAAPAANPPAENPPAQTPPAEPGK
ncbi:MAG: hypothetical protein IT427_11050 [Pirellulales bacterium]|nr:hypothetical protein [Pirellulales bacterium]